MKATIKVNKLPDIPREPTKAKHIDIYVDVVSKYIMPMDAKNEQDKEQREAAKKLKEAKEKKQKERSENKRGKDKAPRKQIRQWTESDVLEMLRLHREGLTHKQIAEKLGRSRGNISTRLQKAKEGGLW